ncbi:hypothetical protein ACOSQ2_006757 [Xanthoceras sorbifolium]
MSVPKNLNSSSLVSTRPESSNESWPGSSERKLSDPALPLVRRTGPAPESATLTLTTSPPAVEKMRPLLSSLLVLLALACES